MRIIIILLVLLQTSIAFAWEEGGKGGTIGNGRNGPVQQR